jgi:hypothetical protein
MLEEVDDGTTNSNITDSLDTKISQSIETIAISEAKEEQPAQPRRVWTTGDQHNADSLELSKLGNKALFYLFQPFCASKKLTEQDLQDINITGGVLGVLLFYMPTLNLGHPLITLISRIFLFVVRFKQVCVKVMDNIVPHDKSQDELPTV